MTARLAKLKRTQPAPDAHAVRGIKRRKAKPLASRPSRKQAKPKRGERKATPAKIIPLPVTKEVVVRKEAVSYRDDNYSTDINFLGIDIPPGWVGVRRELQAWRQPVGHTNRHERRNKKYSHSRNRAKVIQFPIIGRERKSLAA